MPSDTRTTVYLKPNVYRALKVKAATTDRSVSDLVNAAVLESLKEDAVDLDGADASDLPARHGGEVLLEP